MRVWVFVMVGSFISFVRIFLILIRVVGMFYVFGVGCLFGRGGVGRFIGFCLEGRVVEVVFRVYSFFCLG